MAGAGRLDGRNPLGSGLGVSSGREGGLPATLRELWPVAIPSVRVSVFRRAGTSARGPVGLGSHVGRNPLGSGLGVSSMGEKLVGTDGRICGSRNPLGSGLGVSSHGPIRYPNAGAGLTPVAIPSVRVSVFRLGLAKMHGAFVEKQCRNPLGSGLGVSSGPRSVGAWSAQLGHFCRNPLGSGLGVSS